MTGAKAMHRILLVDDVETIALLVKVYLNGMNVEFDTASDGLAAWKQLQLVKPSLVIADVQMPGKDGLELCADIKADPKLKDVPVILYSVMASDATLRRKARMAGAFTVLTKPVSPQELRTVVARGLGIAL